MDTKIGLVRTIEWGKANDRPESPFALLLCKVFKKKILTKEMLEQLEEYGFEITVRERK